MSNMSDIIDALSWLQNGKIQLLFFVVAPSRNLLKSFEDTEQLFVFDYSEESKFPVVLIEEWIPIGQGIGWKDITLAIRERLSQIMTCGCLAVFCMLDGSYASEEDLLNSMSYSSIYAIAYETKIIISDGDLEASEWRDAVVCAQKHVEEKLR